MHIGKSKRTHFEMPLYTHLRWMISKKPKKENNAKKFAVDLFVELHSNDEAIFIILFDSSRGMSLNDALKLIMCLVLQMQNFPWTWNSNEQMTETELEWEKEKQPKINRNIQTLLSSPKKMETINRK